MHKTEVWLRKQLINGETYQMMFTIPDVHSIMNAITYMTSIYGKFLVQVEAKNKELRGVK